ncbi:putative ABC-type ATPase [Runella defluvii]|uniref:Putative ABC-type ATPase n=1 Tax=Runella defluvii TaxID=370973 RepID=A0A7W6ENW2_9BACT|nr:zeta toxin family protein [Runella defluvii]MBB3836687.1 putative ABC-type ATPase [Runella defluvii]
MPTLYIIAGPNGAGKTTAAKVLLPDVFQVNTFINADLIAANLNPTSPESVAMEAGRQMLIEIENCLTQKVTFVIETTLATKSYINLVKKAQQMGYEVVLIYFWLESPNHAVERVARRVRQGGHYIATEVIVRRYWGGLKNLIRLFMPLVDKWIIFDNSDYTEGHPLRIAERLPQGDMIVENSELWLKINNNENS